jgi:hypothetical protein
VVTGVPFTPGEAVGIVAPWFVAIVDSAHGGRLGNALIELAATSAGGVDEVAEAVAALPVRSLPDFAVGLVELHLVRVLLRGGFAAQVERDGRLETFDGTGFRTWREMTVERPSEVRIGVGSELRCPSHYWTAEGIVPASVLVVTTTHEGAEEPRATPTSMPPAGSTEAGLVESAEVAPAMQPEDGALLDLPSPTATSGVSEGEEAFEPQTDVAPASVDLERSTAASDGRDAENRRLEDPSDQTLPPAEDQWIAGVSDLSGAVSESEDPYAELWHTKIRSIEDAAVRDGDDILLEGGAPDGTTQAGEATDRPSDADGDHDGHTRAIDPSLIGAAQDAANGPEPAAGGVPSSPCVHGHPNPPFAVTCRRCLAPVRDVVERVPRADAGVLVLPGGERIVVDRTIVVGRNPKAGGLYTGDPPRLIGLADQPDVSRTHVVIELSGWTATVTDQDSVNGTEVQLPGKPPEQLRPHSPMALVVGARIVLANEVELKLEGG